MSRYPRIHAKHKAEVASARRETEKISAGAIHASFLITSDAAIHKCLLTKQGFLLNVSELPRSLMRMLQDGSRYTALIDSSGIRNDRCGGSMDGKVQLTCNTASSLALLPSFCKIVG